MAKVKLLFETAEGLIKLASKSENTIPKLYKTLENKGVTDLNVLLPPKEIAKLLNLDPDKFATGIRKQVNRAKRKDKGEKVDISPISYNFVKSIQRELKIPGGSEKKGYLLNLGSVMKGIEQGSKNIIKTNQKINNENLLRSRVRKKLSAYAEKKYKEGVINLQQGIDDVGTLTPRQATQKGNKLAAEKKALEQQKYKKNQKIKITDNKYEIDHIKGQTEYLNNIGFGTNNFKKYLAAQNKTYDDLNFNTLDIEVDNFIKNFETSGQNGLLNFNNLENLYAPKNLQLLQRKHNVSSMGGSKNKYSKGSVFDDSTHSITQENFNAKRLTDEYLNIRDTVGKKYAPKLFPKSKDESLKQYHKRIDEIVETNLQNRTDENLEFLKQNFASSKKNTMYDSWENFDKQVSYKVNDLKAKLGPKYDASLHKKRIINKYENVQKQADMFGYKIPSIRENKNIANFVFDDAGVEYFNKGGRVGMSIGGLASDKKRSFAGDQFGKNKIGTLESMLAGIGSGLLDIPKGAFTLGAALMDLGFGTSNAAKVENFFDDLTGLDEKAEATFAGNLTKIMVNLGVPGGFAAKKGAELTKKALLAKKNGNYFKLTDPRLVEKYGTSLNAKGRLYATLGGAGAAGVADGIFVGDPEHVGTIGDMFGGPTQLLENDENSAAREVANRMKFGLDSSLLIGLVGGSGSAIKSLVKRRNELSSNNDSIDKLLGAFRPRGMTSQEFFELNRANIGARAADINYASQVSRDLDKHIDKIFPYVKNPFNKLGNKGRRSFMARLNKTLLSGDINFDAGAKTVRFGEMNKKNVDEIVSLMRDKGGKAEDIQGVLNAFGDIRGGWGNMFTRLGGVMDDAAFEEFSEAFGKKFSDYLGSTYEVFKNKSLIPMFNFRPSAEAVEKATKMFRQAAEEKGTPITKEEAEYYVSKVVESARAPAAFATKGDRSAGVYFNAPDFFANKSTIADIEKLGLSKTTIPLDNLSDAARPVFDELLGKIDDPMQTILTGTNKLSLVSRRNQLFQTLKNENATTAIARQAFLDNPDNIGKEVPPELRGFFRETEIEAMSELGRNVKKIEIDSNRSIEAGITNPLDGLYAEKGVADAIEESAMLARDKSTIKQLYDSFVLYPKATSQLAKTVLSPITHARNFISAGAFATANGLIPGLTVSLDDSRTAFKEAFGMIQTNIPGTRQANDRYRDLLRLGVVNSNVRLGDLQKLLNDVNFGETVTGTQQLRNQMRQLSKLKKWTEDMYTAEDDFWKISSFAMERGRLKKAYQKYGMDFTDDLLDNEAANIVRNNIPNYDMVSSFVKSLRQLPFGNFVSFPAEIYRTSFNIMGQIMKEFKFQHALPDGRIVYPFRDIAMKRAMGFGTTVVGVPAATVAGFQALYDVTEDEMQALRRFVPDWSKNSTLVPIRGDDGKLKYIDFSHANAYDAMIRPWTTMFNGIQKGIDEEELGKNLILSMIDATKETASPFVSEAIWTSAIADISPILGRNGRTQSGRRLWTDETPMGDKFMESIKHLGATVVPGSLPAVIRMKQAVTEEVDEYGRTYEFLDEALGVAGFRAVQVDPVSAMKFKIASFRTGLNDSRREFTGPLLKGGPITAEQVVDQYQKANQAMFRVQKRMFDDYYAARILGASENQLNNTFQDRISDRQVRFIKAGRFKPFVPSENIQKAFADNARAINQPDAFRQARDVIRRIMRQYNNKPLGANELDILENPFRTSLGTTVTEPFTGLQPLQDLGLTTPTVGNNLNQNTLAKGQAVFGPTDTIFGS